MWNWFRNRRSHASNQVVRLPNDTSPKGSYTGLRHFALTLPRENAGIDEPKAEAPIWGVIMEMGFNPTTTVTLRAMADGSASMYFSNGGGFLGGNDHEPLRQAVFALIAMVNTMRAHLQPTTDAPIPPFGQVSFFARTDTGLLHASGLPLTNQALTHPLAPLFRAGDDVVTQLRLLTESQQAKGDKP